MFNFIIEWYVDIDTVQQLIHWTTLRYTGLLYNHAEDVRLYSSMIFYWDSMFDRNKTRHAMAMAQHTNLAFAPVR